MRHSFRISRFSHHLCVTISVATILACALVVLLQRPVQAHHVCGATYVVRYGDTLSAIAEAYGTTLKTLLRLNHGAIVNANVIRVGQKLCVSEGSQSLLTLEIVYGYEASTDPQSNEYQIIGQNGLLGRRVTFKLDPLEPMDFVTRTDTIGAILSAQPEARLLVCRNENESSGESEEEEILALAQPKTYSLIFVKKPQLPLDSLLISTTQTISLVVDANPIPLDAAFPGHLSVALTLWLEASDGVRFPFLVTKLGEASSSAAIYRQGCAKAESFGMLLKASPTTAGAYHALVRFDDETGVLGPAGRKRAAVCAAWRSKPGFFYRWLRALRGCR